ncbi:TetR family transcriptional regulator [Nonomuraea sp. 3-1Str]|uniref:TetR/AcrR family transcriptional regulator n=1 Tax=unclassified Nonomuraea TaxID=2593643 RepID=UPI00285722D8|nr:TetR family transcriptional regulator [Nonomuraea sp. 3-1Str]MDR8409852.1 TetR family transcriptional regulator [Nonomuraea sp. 3-1Str]
MGNREDLFAAAKRCLLEKGYDRSSVRDIASAAGVNMAAIGYHYGSREKLLNQALFALLDEWGDAMGRVLDPDVGLVGMWENLLGRFAGDQALWLASVELFLQAQRRPDLRDQLAQGTREGRRGMAAILENVPEDEVPERAVRTVGMVQMALMSGLMIQSLSDPDNAPTAAEVLEGLRALVALAEK